MKYVEYIVVPVCQVLFPNCSCFSVSLQVYDQLMGRVDAAKERADLALETINNNVDDVDEALEKLRGMGTFCF